MEIDGKAEQLEGWKARGRNEGLKERIQRRKESIKAVVVKEWYVWKIE